MQTLTRIIAVVVDTQKAVFYRQDGSVYELLQGDTKLRPLLEQVVPQINTHGYADVDLSTPNSFAEFEKKSTGGFKFFKVAKEKLKNFFGGDPKEPVLPLVTGVLPSAPLLGTAVEEILKNAVPVQAAEFTEETIAPQRPTVEGNHTPSDRSNDGKEEHFDKHPDTIVAVTPKGDLVPGIERNKAQFAASAANGNVKGLEAFLTRIAAVIKKRTHTIEDLLRFMERGDLPVADDGSIIIFKRLQRRGEMKYVDVHSGKVLQAVGSYVFMDECLVDPNRRNECSSGLHVARRGYIRNFSGDVIVLAKVNPEDVIAVPEYDANKMRVSAYHIIAELTPQQFTAIVNNRPISDAEGGAELLGNVIAGNHIGIVERVRIGAEKGGDLEITPVEPKAKSKKAQRKVKKAIKKRAKNVKPVQALETVDKGGKADKPVDVKQVAKVAKSKTAVKLESNAPKGAMTQSEQVNDLYNKALKGDKKAATELLALKKAAKKGWSVWGLDTSTGETLKALI
jgi:hypothetical protein